MHWQTVSVLSWPAAMSSGAICSGAWLGAFAPQLAQSELNNEDQDDEVDAGLIFDQDAPVTGILGDECLLQQLPLQQGSGVNISSGTLNGWMDGPACTSPSSSPRQDEEGRKQGSTVAKCSSKGGRKCTSLAQREAHKRYREKKKQSVSLVWLHRHSHARCQVQLCCWARLSGHIA
jgi:hypothetical protein